MTAQYIKIGRKKWNVLVYYNVGKYDMVEVIDSLESLDCPKDDIRKAVNALKKKNAGFTFSNSEYKMSIVCIGEATDIGLFVNTAIHEAKHVLSHICSYYNIDETSEDAAYLIGHIVHRMYMMLEKILRVYVNL